MGIEQDRARLAEILKQHSVRRGAEFVLASGRRSNVYVDARVTTLRAAAMPLIGRLFLDKMREHGWRPAAVGGLTMGADRSCPKTFLLIIVVLGCYASHKSFLVFAHFIVISFSPIAR